MMKKTLILLLIVSVVLIFGCTQTTTTNNGGAPATEPKEDPLASLFAAPDSYCVTYSTTMPNAPQAPGDGSTSEMSYCRDKSNVAIEIDALGTKMHAFCLNGKGSSCYGEGASAMCSEDTNICSSVSDPFVQVGVEQYQPSMYVKSSTKQFAGLTAQCYSMDIVAAGKAQGQDTSQIPEQMRYMSFCYHPKYKYILYYSFAGTTMEVKNFVTPAPAGKFVLPAAVQIVE